jgi:hypothetical protein
VSTANLWILKAKAHLFPSDCSPIDRDTTEASLRFDTAVDEVLRRAYERIAKEITLRLYI